MLKYALRVLFCIASSSHCARGQILIDKSVIRNIWSTAAGSKRNPPVQPLIKAVRYAQHHKHKKRSFPTAKQNFKSQPQEKGAP